MLFNSWFDLLHVAFVGTSVYVGLIVGLRVTGKRTLSKWNAFDFVATIALGSTLATAFLSKEVALAEGLFAVGLLIALQFVITWMAVRFSFIRHLVKAEPTLLLEEGEFCERALRDQRVTRSEVRAAIRSAGCAALEDVSAVVLETDGSFSVIKRSQQTMRTALEDVEVRDAKH